jgi:DNA-binding transcriptional regulator YhcF (GntR family)
MMQDRLDRTSPIPLFVQIVEALRWMIANGSYAPGEALPSARTAAELWGVNRHTVGHAYRELVAQGLAVRRAHTRSVEVVAGGPERAPGPGASAVDEFVDRMLSEADSQLGLAPPALVAALAKRFPGRTRPAVSVVECNEPMASDLAAQIGRRWAVEAEPWVLGSQGKAPAGDIVATMFHFAELRHLWPNRIAQIRFVTVRPSAELGRVVDELCRDLEKPLLMVVGDASEEEARNQAADLRGLFPEGRFSYELAVRVEGLPSQRVARRGAVLFSPRAWGRLTPEERRRERFVGVRYRIDPIDLETLDRAFGWWPVAPTATTSLGAGTG